MNRRQTLKQIAGICGGILTSTSVAATSRLVPARDRKFTMDLNPGAIGVSGSLPDIIALAARNGFESVAPNSGYLASLDESGRQELAASMKESGIVWGAAGLPVDFRKDEAKLQAGLKDLPRHAKALQQSGVTRVGTWLMPCHDDLTYVENFRQHATRLKECVKILADHGQRFGME